MLAPLSRRCLTASRVPSKHTWCNGVLPYFESVMLISAGNFRIGLVDLQSYLNNHEEGNKIMKYLVESGADINCRDTKDQSVLDYAYKTCRPHTWCNGVLPYFESVMLISAPFSINKDTIPFIWTVFLTLEHSFWLENVNRRVILSHLTF
jgi:hypothetical protein